MRTHEQLPACRESRPVPPAEGIMMGIAEFRGGFTTGTIGPLVIVGTGRRIGEGAGSAVWTAPAKLGAAVKPAAPRGRRRSRMTAGDPTWIAASDSMGRRATP